jgi:hypothetical protein
MHQIKRAIGWIGRGVEEEEDCAVAAIDLRDVLLK